MVPNSGQSVSSTFAEEAGDAEYQTGVSLHQSGQLDQAAAAYSQAISINNRHCRAIHNLATIMFGKGEKERALGLFKLATVIKPDYGEAYTNWALLLKDMGDAEQAIEKFQQALRVDPSIILNHTRLADTYREQDQHENAIAAYRAALELDPQSPEILNNLGLCHGKIGEDQEALKCFDAALAADPDFIGALVNSANILGALDLNDLAIERFNKALELDPNVAATHNNLGILLSKVGRFDEALASFDKAIELNGGSDEVVNNLANALDSSGRSEEAIEKFGQLLAVNDEHYAAYNNLGTAHKNMGAYDEAELNFRKAIEIAPDYADSHANLGYILLTLGRFEEGWQEYAWRGEIKGSKIKRRSYEQPAWTGQNITGKTLYVYPEQGLGDIVQFARYVPLLKARGARVVMEIPHYLTALFEGLKGVDSFNLQGTPPPDFDLHVSIMDLPQHFQTTLETIPGKAGYLDVADSLKQAWETRLAADQDFRVGMVWAGNPKHGNDHNRSLQLEQMRPLVDLAGVTVYSLQVGKDGEASALFGERVVDLAPQLTTFAETAAAMSNMDLIVSVDTSPLHVAGALGLPVWGLIPFVPDWRWLLDRDDSPWYPSLRLFRQDQDKAWEPVIERVTEALRLKMRRD